MKTLSVLKDKWKTDYNFKTAASAAAALAVTAFFALYNGFLGIRHSSIWHGTICVYYLSLVLLRAWLLRALRISEHSENGEALRRRMYLMSAVLFLILNASLIVPVSIMTIQKKPVNMTLIPAIGMASYTTYKVIMAVRNFSRRRQTDNGLVRLLRVISFIEALVSLMTLQNTLIMVTSAGGDPAMLKLSALTNGGMMLLILLISAGILANGIRTLLNSRQERKEEEPV